MRPTFFGILTIEKRLKKRAQNCGSAAELCAQAVDIFGKPITLLAIHELPKKVLGVALQYRNKCLILYNPTSFELTDSVSIQLSILHELAHIALGHLDGLSVDLEAVIKGKTDFTDQQEQEAEILASELMELLIDVRALSPHTSPRDRRQNAGVGKNPGRGRSGI
jgi:hypothetical protein